MSLSKTPVHDLLVSDFMIVKMIRVTPQMKLRDVAELFVRNGISGAPIVDQNDHVLSMMGEGDTLRLAASEGLEVQLSHCMDKLLPLKDLHALKVHSTFLDAYRTFLKYKMHRLPVTDDVGLLKGLVTRSLILKMFVEAVHGQKISRPGS